MDTIPAAPVPIPRQQSVPFEPDGGVPMSGLLMTMVFTFGSALVIGGVVSFVHQWIYLILLFPMFMGLGVAAAGAAGVKHGKMRSPFQAGLLGLLGGTLVMLASHFGSYLLFLLAQPGLLGQGFSFFHFMDLVATVGVTIGKVGQGQDKGMNLGYIGSYIYWSLEAIGAAGIACYIMREPARAPFCVTCQSWKPGQVIGGLAVDRGTVKDIMNQGDLQRLREVGAPAENGLPVAVPVVFSAYACPNCGQSDTLDINLKEYSVNAKGEQKVEDLGTWTFAGEALPAWEAVFPPPLENPPPVQPEPKADELPKFPEP